MIDGGATACLRTATSEERSFPTVDVQLATGACQLHVNHAGTLLSQSPVSPIVSVAALIRLGYSLNWSDQRCDISHPVHGRLDVDTSSGCPEVSAKLALDLIGRYEQMVGKKQAREERVRRMMVDLQPLTDEKLATAIRAEGSEAESAPRVMLGRKFDQIPAETLEQLVAPVQQISDQHTWNRKARRKQNCGGGLLLHIFCGESRKAFEDIAAKQALTLVTVDLKEDLLRQSTYQHLLLQAIRGRIKVLVGGPPCRSSSICRYFPLKDGSTGPRPVRTRGESICEMDHDALSGSEVAMRQIDDLLFLRFLSLFCVSCECNRDAGLPDPGFGIEQPEDPEDWVTREDCSGSPSRLADPRPEKGFAFFLSTSSSITSLTAGIAVSVCKKGPNKGPTDVS